MPEHTPLTALHLQAGGRMVEFAGWELPLHYGSQLAEHHAVRQAAGMFDVSHMTVVDLEGPGCRGLLGILLANDVGRLSRPGQALYSCLLNDSAGILDDLIVYAQGPDRYRIVANAATRRKVLDWLQRHGAGTKVRIAHRTNLAMISVQGPKARVLAESVLSPELAEGARSLESFESLFLGDWQVARTGYTGEDGYEILMPVAQAAALWRSLATAGVQPCGLGARDTLRLEAGMRLYGVDMDESTDPLDAGLGWTVAWLPDSRRFIGRETLFAKSQSGPATRFVGLVLADKGVLRNHQLVEVPGAGQGLITSGGFSPSLNRAIALARLPAGDAEVCQVEIRGQRKAARIVSPRFVRHGRILVDTNLSVH